MPTLGGPLDYCILPKKLYIIEELKKNIEKVLGNENEKPEKSKRRNATGGSGRDTPRLRMLSQGAWLNEFGRGVCFIFIGCYEITQKSPNGQKKQGSTRQVSQPFWGGLRSF